MCIVSWWGACTLKPKASNQPIQIGREPCTPMHPPVVLTTTCSRVPPVCPTRSAPESDCTLSSPRPGQTYTASHWRIIRISLLPNRCPQPRCGLPHAWMTNSSKPNNIEKVCRGAKHTLRHSHKYCESGNKDQPWHPPQVIPSSPQPPVQTHPTPQQPITQPCTPTRHHTLPSDSFHPSLMDGPHFLLACPMSPSFMDCSLTLPCPRLKFLESAFGHRSTPNVWAQVCC